MSGVFNTYYNLNQNREDELRGLIANHSCELAEKNECVCIAWLAELNGERV